MKKIGFLLILLIAIAPAYSQNEGTSTKPGRSTTFVKNSFWDNWFIGAGAGANIYFGDSDANAKFWDRLTVTPNFQIGTWFNPYFGTRVKISGGTNIHTFNQDANVMARTRYIAAEANLMWNMTDYLMNYNSKRVYNFIPYVGVGYAYGWDYKNVPVAYLNGGDDHVNSLTFDAGIINRFNLSERVAFDVELSGKMLRDRFDQRTGGKVSYDVLGTVSASLVVKLGKPTFSEAILRDQTEIDNLNGRINDLRSQVDRLSQRPTDCPEQEVIEVVKKQIVNKGNEPINNVVLFKISHTKIDPMQEVNVNNVAQYLKDNSDMRVRVVGYTDKATGTAAINERLSRERAQNVADALIGKYGVSKDRVIVDWKGQTEPPFSVDEWNRAVIMYLEEIK